MSDTLVDWLLTRLKCSFGGWDNAVAYVDQCRGPIGTVCVGLEMDLGRIACDRPQSFLGSALPRSGVLRFEDALRYLRLGDRVRRKQWSGHLVWSAGAPTITYKWPSNVDTEWQPTQQDLTASDWRVLLA